MAARAPLYIHASGWQDSFDTTNDHIPMSGLNIGGATYAAGNIVLNSGKVQGLTGGTANGEALAYNQTSAQLNGLTIDTNNLSLANNATITGLPATPTGSTEATSKAYVDNIASNIKHKAHVSCLKMVDDSLVTAPTLGAGDAGNAYVVAGTGGAWSTFAIGDIVEWDGSAWALLTAQSGAEPPDDIKVIVTDTSAAGSFATHEEEVGTYDAGLNSWSFSAAEAAEVRTIQNDDGDSIYEHLAYMWDAENDVWILFNGAGQVNAGLGLTKSGNTIDVGAGDGISVDASYVNIDLATNPGLALTGVTPNKELEVLLKSASELAKDASGIYIVGLPSLFQVGGVATNSTVDAAALNTLTGAGNADTEHSHAHSATTGQGEDDHHNRSHVITSSSDHTVSGETVGAVLTITGTGDTFDWQTVSGVDEAKYVENAWTAGEGITKADPVYISTAADNTVLLADASDDAEFLPVGLATTTVAITESVDVVSHGLVAGLITGLGFTRGQEIFLDNTSGLTNSPPTGAVHVVRVGVAKNATDLYIDIHDYGKKPS